MSTIHAALSPSFQTRTNTHIRLWLIAEGQHELWIAGEATMSFMKTIARSLGKYAVLCVSIAVAGISWSGSTLRAQQAPPAPKLEYAFEGRAEVADPTVVGQMPVSYTH